MTTPVRLRRTRARPRADTADPLGGHGRPRVVVVGGGFGGLAAVHGLRGSDADVTLIDRHTYNTFQPLLYQVATATLNAGDITWFLRSIRAQQPNVRFRKGTVVSMDHASRTIALDGGQTVGYDYLIIAAGVTANYFNIPGAAEQSMPLYTRSQALALRDRVFAKLEEAVVNGQDRDLRIVVVGGGATGVETAGALAELRNNDMPVTFPELDPTRTHITLIEQSPFLLAPFHPRLREYARRSLKRRGVDLRLDTPVKKVRPNGVVIGDHVFLPADVVVWASGVRVHDQVAQWDVPQGRGGRITVDDHLRVDGLDGVYAVGDIAVEPGDRALPQLAQPARQGGTYVAALVKAKLTGNDVPSFNYHDKGTLATIGRNSAVAQVKGLPRLTGFIAWVIWIVAHVFSLLSNRNRLATMLNLSARYLFWHHSHNAIVGETPTIILDHPPNPGGGQAGGVAVDRRVATLGNVDDRRAATSGPIRSPHHPDPRSTTQRRKPPNHEAATRRATRTPPRGLARGVIAAGAPRPGPNRRPRHGAGHRQCPGRERPRSAAGPRRPPMDHTVDHRRRRIPADLRLATAAHAIPHRLVPAVHRVPLP